MPPAAGSPDASRGVLTRARTAANRRYARLAIQRERRARRASGIDATLVLADHWSGSVQQFYHFLLGYLGPMAVWARQHPGQRIWVRDCGPMNVWFDAVRPGVAVDVVSVNTALGVLIGSRRDARIVRGLDDPARFDRRRLVAAADAIGWLLDADRGVVAGPSSVVVVDRRTSEDFYHSAESETHMSGAERRSTPGLGATVEALRFASPAVVVDTARIAPAEQIRLFAGANAIVGQHGAGLVHMLWLPRGSTVVEIAPPLVPGVDHIFGELAEVLGHRYVVVAQDDVHAPVDPQALESGLRAAGLLRE